jgi:hypothetical protein
VVWVRGTPVEDMYDLQYGYRNAKDSKGVLMPEQQRVMTAIAIRQRDAVHLSLRSTAFTRSLRSWLMCRQEALTRI